MGLGHEDEDKFGMRGHDIWDVGVRTRIVSVSAKVGVNANQVPLKLHISHDSAPNLKIF